MSYEGRGASISGLREVEALLRKKGVGYFLEQEPPSLILREQINSSRVVESIRYSVRLEVAKVLAEIPEEE